MSLGETYYVVFTPGEDRWWCRWLHPTIRHCYLIKAQAGKWLVFGKHYTGMDLYTLDEFCLEDHNVAAVKVASEDSYRGLLMVNTCVGHVKQVIGVRNPLILTPYQLYKHLMRDRYGVSKTEKTRAYCQTSCNRGETRASTG